MSSFLADSGKFEWLADLQKSQCYTTCDWANPAKSTDFGSNGYTASLTDWHELLQLTAPDKDCGIVFVRGSFPNTPDAILSRAQRRDDTGSKGTFGLHLLPESAAGGVAVSRDHEKEHTGYRLGARRAQGLANFRWPYMQYELKRQGWVEKRSGTYEVISFVKDGTMFQIIRLSPGILPKKGPDRYARRYGHDTQQIKFRVGGQVQFGCPCSNGADQSSKKDFNMESTNGGLQLIYDSKEYKHRLEIQVFVNGEHKIITASESLSAGIVEARFSGDEPTIIVSTYTLRDLSDSYPKSDAYLMIPMVSSRQIEDYLGVSNISVEMTDKLWLASLTEQFDAIETIELCAVARYVEQILGVSSVPIPSSNSTASSNLTDHTTPADFNNVSGIALICNIITPQYVDLKSTFWQIRFLVKAHEFLASRTFEQSLLEDDEITYLVQMRTAYLMRIRRHIQLALVWMTRAQVKIDKILLPIEPGHASTGPKMNYHSGRERAVKIDSSYNQACFTRIAVWYVMKYCNAAMTSEFRTYIQVNGLGALPHPDEWSEPRVDKESTPKNDVLLWFDVSCLLLLWQELHPEDDSPNIEARQRILRSQEHREKIVKRLRKSQSEPYSMDDEELDRLFLLGEELGLPLGTSASLATARAEQTRSRIAKRRWTEIFNCGPRSTNIRRSTRITSNAPWELACLNHHSLLKTSLDPTKDVNLSQSRDSCFEFFLSDYTFMVSWDRADKSMIGKWWDIEPGSVICATLLDLIGKTKRQPALSNRPTEDLSRTQINMTQSAFGANQMARGLEEAVRELVVQLQSKQDTPLSGGDFYISPRGFDWLRCKPSKIYHLKSWVQSLDDTPEVFHSMQTTFTPLRRGLIKYLTGDDSSESPKAPEYKRDTIHQMIPPDSLEFLSTFDFKLNDDFGFTKEQISLTESDKVSHQKKLLTSLNDCLVDQGTKYKIFFAEKCCQEVVSAFVYIWHPDALDTFSNYFSTISHFADTREALWTSTIILSHWKLLPTNIPTDSSDPFHEGKENAGRTNGIFPPNKVATTGKFLEERSSFLVITGDAHGYNWICTILSSLTDFKSIKNSIERLPEILRLFIHQQASGRCLVFLIILEHICEKLASEYSRILEHLDGVVELGEKVLFEGLEWELNDPIDKLKRMIWGGQALRVLDDKLSASLSQIHHAKESMDHMIKQDEGQQHIELLQEYTNVLEGFGKRFSILSNVQVRIQLRIKHITGLRDGISTVTNVEDTRAALRDSRITVKQGNNIRVLTLITIAYLPLGYVTGLFSENHGILPDNADGQLYAGLVVIFMVGTYSLALSLDIILKFLEPRWSRLKGYIRLDNSGWYTEDARLKEGSSSGEASPMKGGSADRSKVSTGRATGHRGWTGRKRAGHDTGTQLELV